MFHEVCGKKKTVPCKYCIKNILLLARIMSFHLKLSGFKSQLASTVAKTTLTPSPHSSAIQTARAV